MKDNCKLQNTVWCYLLNSGLFLAEAVQHHSEEVIPTVKHEQLSKMSLLLMERLFIKKV